MQQVENDIKRMEKTMTPAQIVEWIALEAIEGIEITWHDIKKGLQEAVGGEVDVLLPILHIVFKHITHGRDEVSVGAIIHEMEDLFHHKH